MTDRNLQKTLKALDEAGFALPEDIEFYTNDEFVTASSFADLAAQHFELGASAEKSLLLFAEELTSLKDRRLYDFAVKRGLTLELDAPAACHFTEILDLEDEFPEALYSIALTCEREADMINSLAHEASHNLDTIHLFDDGELKEWKLHSTSGLFRQCFNEDLKVNPKGLAQQINVLLERRNYTPEALIANGHAAKDVDGILHDERFAIMGELFSTGMKLPPSPLLEAYYHQFVELDLAIGTGELEPYDALQMRRALKDAVAEPAPLAASKAAPAGKHSKAVQDRQTERQLLKHMHETGTGVAQATGMAAGGKQAQLGR